jgi:hypothetical protein
MKKINVLMMTACMALIPMLQSCDDDDHYSLGDFTMSWATIRTTGNTFYLESDTWGTCWLVNTNLGHYQGVDGQRVWAVFNPLSDSFEGYDHAVKLLDIRDALTKSVEKLTDETSETLGNDPVRIYQGDMSVGGGYLNIVFMQNMPKDTETRQLISLAADESYLKDSGKEPREDDGYIHVELRYNTYGNTTGYYNPALVSFNLNQLNITPDTKGIKVKLNSEVNGEVEVTFDKQSDDKGSNTLSNFDFSKMQLK